MESDQSLDVLGFDAFVELLMQRFAAAPGVSAVAFDAVNQAIRHQHAGRTHFFRPQNAYVAYQKAPYTLEQLVRVQLDQLTQGLPPSTLEEARGLLRPMLRARRYLDLSQLSIKVSGHPGADAAPEFAFRALAGELVITLVLDLPASVQQVSRDQLVNWNIDFEAALAIAMDNLVQASEEIGFEQVAPGIYALLGDDVFNATRLLLTDALQTLPLSGSPLVGLPSRGELLVADSADRNASVNLVKLTAARLGEAERPLTADLLCFQDGTWSLAASEWMAHPDLVAARHVLLHGDYQQQTELLNRLYRAKGKDVFVASYQLGRRSESEPWFNYAQLTAGVSHTLLPKAEHMAFLSEAQELIMVPWAIAAKALGAQLQRVAVQPVRYLVKAFPDASVIDAMRPHAQVHQTQTNPAQVMQAAADRFRQRLQAQLGASVGHGEAALQQLDDHLEQVHQSGRAMPGREVVEASAFLGQLMVELLKGQWEQQDGHVCIALPGDNIAFPQAHVEKQLVHGRAGGESVAGKFEATAALLNQAPTRNSAFAADARKQAQLEQVRQKLAEMQSPSSRELLLSMRAVKPSWMESLDALNEVFSQQRKLLTEGKVVWAALVMANNLLFRPGSEDCPALLIYSHNNYFDSRPQELVDVAQKIYTLKNTKQDDPELARLADLLTGEADRTMGWQVPQELSLRDVLGAIFMVFRKHIPKGVMQGNHFPILVHPDTKAVMLAPFELWPVELIRDWKASGGRTLEDIRELPEAIKVTHQPAVVSAVVSGDEGDEYVWEFSTQVEAQNGPLTLIEFGAFSQIGDEWMLSTVTGKPFSATDFAEWYNCQDAQLLPGVPAVDRKNWSRRKQLTSSRTLWYYIGRDADGNLVRGEAEVEQRGTLIPPDSTAPKRAPSGGIMSKLSRMFSANEAEEQLRFDGVYRAKFVPMQPSDNKFCYLRLLPDNLVLFAVSSDNPSTMVSWFNLQARMATVGSYKLKGDAIQVEIPVEGGSLVFNGAVAKNRLLLNSKRFSNLPTYRDEFLFMGWRP